MEGGPADRRPPPERAPREGTTPTERPRATPTRPRPDAAGAAQAAPAPPRRNPAAEPKPVPIAPRSESHEAPRPGAAAGSQRPRRLPQNRGAPTPEADAAAGPAGSDDAETWDDQLQRRRELRRAARSRRGALPAGAPAAPTTRRPAPPPPAESAPAAEAPPPVPADDGPLPYPEAPVFGEAPEAPPTRARRALVDAPDSDAVVENGPIVAPDSVSGGSLTAVIAIMTFLCAMLLGSALIIDRAATQWSATVLDDISVTVLPLDGDAIGRRLEAAANLMRQAPGLSDVRILPTDQSDALLEPWLGSGVDLSLLPVPRLVTARRTDAFDGAALSGALAAVPGTSLDDHSGWSERLARMAGGVTGGALLALALMLIATVICIVFATRATIASNAATVEVLHVLGAEDGFIVAAFRGRFLRIGLRGAALGLAGALVLFGGMELWSLLSSSAESRQAAAFLGSPRIGPFGFAAVLALALLIAALVTVTTSLAVRAHLEKLSR